MNAVYFPSGVHPKHERDFGCALFVAVAARRAAQARAAARRPRQLASGAPRRSRRSCAEPRIRALLSPPAVAARDLRRLAQARGCACWRRTPPPSADPVVILGDFNSHDKVEELERAGLRWLTPTLGHTTQFKLLGIIPIVDELTTT